MNVFILGSTRLDGQFHEEWKELKYACRALIRYRDLEDVDLFSVIVFYSFSSGDGFYKTSGDSFLFAFDKPEFHDEP